MTNEEKQAIKEIVQRAAESGIRRAHTHCPLLEAGISHETHKLHHLLLKQGFKDLAAIRTGALASVIGGGILAILTAVALVFRDEFVALLQEVLK